MTHNTKMRGRSLSIHPDKLTPYEKNSRVHSPAQVTMIVDSITEFGFVKPIIMDENKMILAGHGAWMAAKELSMSTVPVREIRGLTDEQKRGYVIADNRSSELSKWDWDVLGSELEELQSMDMDMKPLGFEDFGGEQTERRAHNVTIGDGRFLLQIEFEDEPSMQRLYEELDQRGLEIKVLE